MNKMLLLTFEEWLGPSRIHPDHGKQYPIMRTVAFASNLSLAEALELLSLKLLAYARKFPTMAWELRLVGSQLVPCVSSEILEKFDVKLIEGLSDYEGEPN